MTNTPGPMDTMRDMWANATPNAVPKKGDTVIRKVFNRFEVFTVEDDFSRAYSTVRILRRAPKPKPAWHDAVAVTATATDELGDEITAVWVREGEELWCSEDGGMVLRDDLRDVTPLIEAKVTDEAMQRVFNALDPSVNWRLSMTKEDEKYVRYIVAAALGLEAT